LTAPNPLIDVAEFVRERAKASRVAVIFDLDSTLFCVSPRTEMILRRLSSEPSFRARFSEQAEILSRVEVLPTDWGVRAALERAQVPSTLEFFLEVRDYWHKYFFSSHDLHQDKIYPSANEYVRHLHQLGADILYLTGRSEGPMREGTVKALNQWGFPLLVDGKLMMKPSDVLTDESFKALALQGLTHDYDHIWFFENEPVIIEQVRGLLPQVRIVFMNSVHAGRAAAPTDLPTIGMDYTHGVKRG